MGLFSLGRGIELTRRVPITLERTYELSHGILEGYKDQGFKVDFSEEEPPQKTTAHFTNSEGTRITATVEISPQAENCELKISLAGKIFVGGVQGMFATDSKVRQVARDGLKNLLDQVFSERALRNEPRFTLPKPEPEPELEPEPEETVEEVAEETQEEPEPVSKPEAIVTEKPAPAPAPAPAPVSTSKNSRSAEERLLLLKELLDKGLINDEDFKNKKQDILKSL